MIDYSFYQYCGILPDGTWKSYTYVCEAYHDGALAIYSEVCDCLNI